VRILNRYYTRYGIEVKDGNGGITTYGYNIKNHMDFYYLLIGLELQDFESYLKDMDKNLSNIENELLEKDNDACNFLLADDYEYANRVKIRYPFILNNSAFVALYSLLEDTSIKLYRVAQTRLNQFVPMNKQSPQLKDYLYAIEEILDIKITDKIKNDINNYRLIRNCIVHHRGRLKDKFKRAALKLKEKGIEIIENEKGILINLSVCENFIKDLSDLFKLLSKSLIDKEVKLNMHNGR